MVCRNSPTSLSIPTILGFLLQLSTNWPILYLSPIHFQFPLYWDSFCNEKHSSQYNYDGRGLSIPTILGFLLQLHRSGSGISRFRLSIPTILGFLLQLPRVITDRLPIQENFQFPLYWDSFCNEERTPTGAAPSSGLSIPTILGFLLQRRKVLETIRMRISAFNSHYIGIPSATLMANEASGSTQHGAFNSHYIGIPSATSPSKALTSSGRSFNSHYIGIPSATRNTYSSRAWPLRTLSIPTILGFLLQLGRKTGRKGDFEKAFNSHYIGIPSATFAMRS